MFDKNNNEKSLFTATVGGFITWVKISAIAIAIAIAMVALVASCRKKSTSPDSPQATAPGQPGAIAFSATTTTSFTATWPASTSFGKKTDGTAYNATEVIYTVTINPSTGVTIVSNNQLQRTFTGLTRDTTYTVSVTASNPDGGAGTAREGTQSTSASDATAPGQPGTIAFSGTSTTSITATWPASDPGKKTDGTDYQASDVIYTVTISPSVGTMVSNNQLERTFNGLTPGTSYTVTVTPSTPDGGPGPATDATENTLSAATRPEQLSYIAFSNVTSTGFEVHWPATNNPGKKHDGTDYQASDVTYTIRVTPQGGVATTVTGVSGTFRAYTGLTTGTMYTVAVQPVTTEGGTGQHREGTVTPAAPVTDADREVWTVAASGAAITAKTTVMRADGSSVGVTIAYTDAERTGNLLSPAFPSDWRAVSAEQGSTNQDTGTYAQQTAGLTGPDGIYFTVTFASDVTIGQYFFQPRNDSSAGVARGDRTSFVFLNAAGTELTRTAGNISSANPVWTDVNIANVRSVRMVLDRSKTATTTDSRLRQQFNYANLRIR